MMFYGRYSPEIISLMKCLVSEGESVFDIGAQLGYLTAHLAQLVGKDGKVYSFEPDPDALSRLRRSVEANGTDHVTIFPVAVGDEAGTLTFNVSPTVGWSTAVKGAHHNDLHPIEVTVVRIDDMAWGGQFRRPVRFVKVDVEGFECCVLDGMRELIRTDSPLILVEVNPMMLQPTGHTARDLLQRLSQDGRRLYVVSERKGVLSGGQLRLTQVTPGSELPFCDVLSVPERFQLPEALRL
jgi:FkbM family methyltransferase